MFSTNEYIYHYEATVIKDVGGNPEQILHYVK
jgi:hypothetical protein